jgi:hypothetical protein
LAPATFDLCTHLEADGAPLGPRQPERLSATTREVSGLIAKTPATEDLPGQRRALGQDDVSADMAQKVSLVRQGARFLERRHICHDRGARDEALVEGLEDRCVDRGRVPEVVSVDDHGLEVIGGEWQSPKFTS